MERITYESVIGRLSSSIPEFHTDEEHVRDHLVHLVFDDLTDFVKEHVESNRHDQLLRRIFGFIEEAISDGDRPVLDAVRDSFLEGLADSPEHLGKASRYMGKATRKLLREAKRNLHG